MKNNNLTKGAPVPEWRAELVKVATDALLVAHRVMAESASQGSSAALRVEFDRQLALRLKAQTVSDNAAGFHVAIAVSEHQGRIEKIRQGVMS